jgi:hypothetical protein
VCGPGGIGTTYSIQLSGAGDGFTLFAYLPTQPAASGDYTCDEGVQSLTAGHCAIHTGNATVNYVSGGGTMHVNVDGTGKVSATFASISLNDPFGGTTPGPLTNGDLRCP